MGASIPRVTNLVQAALKAKVPHNYFALWMMTPAQELSGVRAVDRLKESSRLVRLLTAKDQGSAPGGTQNSTG